MSTKFILLINVKMSIMVGVLTFISMINTTVDRLKEKSFFIFSYISFNEQLKSCSIELRMKKKFYNLGVWVLKLSSDSAMQV